MTYFLPKGYVERLKPLPYPDEDDGISWQCGVYDLAHSILSGRHVFRSVPEQSTVVDIGCGRARKLNDLRDVHLVREVIGYDCAETVTWLRQNATWLDSRVMNLELPTIDAPRGSLVICADVIEHLVAPDALLSELARLHDEGCTVILSTPDRILHYGPDNKGPPPNKSHVREWTMAEFALLCESVGLSGGEWLYTQTHDKDSARRTITGVFR